jgi:hypothetical protein
VFVFNTWGLGAQREDNQGELSNNICMNT